MIEENSFKYINVSAEMQCSTDLKQLFLNSTKLDFYRALQKAEFPK
jgi:hypothetical protein